MIQAIYIEKQLMQLTVTELKNPGPRAPVMWSVVGVTDAPLHGGNTHQSEQQHLQPGAEDRLAPSNPF